MKKILGNISLCILFLISIQVTAQTTSKSFNFEKIKSSNIVVLIQDGASCSGVIVGEHTVLTSLHCFVRYYMFYDSAIVKDGSTLIPAVLAKLSGAEDLALLTVKDSFNKLRIAKIGINSVQQFDKVAIIGTTNKAEVIDIGMVVSMTSPTQIGSGGMPYMVSIGIWYGMSGGGIYNENTELVGIGTAMLGKFALSPQLSGIKEILK